MGEERAPGNYLLQRRCRCWCWCFLWKKRNCSGEIDPGGEIHIDRYGELVSEWLSLRAMSLCEYKTIIMLGADGTVVRTLVGLL